MIWCCRELKLAHIFAGFYKLGVLSVGVLITRALLFGVHLRAPGFWTLPHTMHYIIDSILYVIYTRYHVLDSILGPLVLGNFHFKELRGPDQAMKDAGEAQRWESKCTKEQHASGKLL